MSFHPAPTPSSDQKVIDDFQTVLQQSTSYMSYIPPKPWYIYILHNMINYEKTIHLETNKFHWFFYISLAILLIKQMS
jgi:hypothetical protein